MAKNFWIGLLLGGAAGVITGLLIAPGSGQDNRRKVSDVAHSASGRIVGFASGAKIKARGAVTSIKQSI